MERGKVSSQDSDTRHWSNFAKRECLAYLTKWKTKPQSRISISERSRIRLLKESISFKLPSQLLPLSINLVLLKSPINDQGTAAHQACKERRSCRKKGLSALSLGPYTKVTQKTSWMAHSLSLTDIENLVARWLLFSKNFPFHSMSWPPDAPLESWTANSLIRIPPIDWRKVF